MLKGWRAWVIMADERRKRITVVGKLRHGAMAKGMETWMGTNARQREAKRRRDAENRKEEERRREEERWKQAGKRAAKERAQTAREKILEKPILEVAMKEFTGSSFFSAFRADLEAASPPPKPTSSVLEKRVQAAAAADSSDSDTSDSSSQASPVKKKVVVPEKVIKDAFDRIDTNKDGLISRAEWAQARARGEMMTDRLLPNDPSETCIDICYNPQELRPHLARLATQARELAAKAPDLIRYRLVWLSVEIQARAAEAKERYGPHVAEAAEKIAAAAAPVAEGVRLKADEAREKLVVVIRTHAPSLETNVMKIKTRSVEASAALMEKLTDNALIERLNKLPRATAIVHDVREKMKGYIGEHQYLVMAAACGLLWLLILLVMLWSAVAPPPINLPPMAPPPMAPPPPSAPHIAILNVPVITGQSPQERANAKLALVITFILTILILAALVIYRYRGPMAERWDDFRAKALTVLMSCAVCCRQTRDVLIEVRDFVVHWTTCCVKCTTCVFNIFSQGRPDDTPLPTTSRVQFSQPSPTSKSPASSSSRGKQSAAAAFAPAASPSKASSSKSSSSKAPPQTPKSTGRQQQAAASETSPADYLQLPTPAPLPEPAPLTHAVVTARPVSRNSENRRQDEKRQPDERDVTVKDQKRAEVYAINKLMREHDGYDVEGGTSPAVYAEKDQLEAQDLSFAAPSKSRHLKQLDHLRDPLRTPAAAPATVSPRRASPVVTPRKASPRPASPAAAATPSSSSARKPSPRKPSPTEMLRHKKREPTPQSKTKPEVEFGGRLRRSAW